LVFWAATASRRKVRLGATAARQGYFGTTTAVGLVSHRRFCAYITKKSAIIAKFAAWHLKCCKIRKL
jgi:hypothetical protein